MNNYINSPIVSLNVYDVKSPKEKTNNVNGRPFYSLSYRKSGTVKLDIGKETFISHSGCITFIPKGLSYSTEIIEDTHMIVIHFNVSEENMSSTPFVTEVKNHQFEQLFNLVLKNYSPEDINNYECYSEVYKILAEIQNHFQKKYTDRINPSVIKAKEIIEKNFADNNFNIDSLVSILDISASHLRSEFKKVYSVTPIEYLKHVRLQNSISYLASSYYSIEEIAKKSGYSSASYFIHAFRQGTGYSPLKYKENFLSD